MKKYILFAVLFLYSYPTFAQPWMPNDANGPIKFADVVANYYKVYPNETNNQIKDKVDDAPGEGMKSVTWYLL